MSSQRPGRHQRRASQSVFVLPDNLASLDVDDAPAGADGGKAAGEQQGRPPPAAAARHHRRAMSVAAVGSTRDLDLIKEDSKVGA
ncbi:hypothetical protein ACP4OV_028889 [Aristida adscensionis]